MIECFRKIVKVEKFGNVNELMIDKILEFLAECYERLGPPMTYSANLRVFEKSEAEMFFASHDASSGKPTISVYLDKLTF